jgi:hypothetical protein
MDEFILTRGPWLAFCLLIFAFLNALYAFYLVKFGKVTVGNVIRMDASNEGETPIVEFVAEDQKTYTFRVKTVRGQDQWSVGKTCAVRYDPRNPKRAHVDAPLQRWMLVFILVGGAIFLLATIQVLKFFH